MSCRRVYYYTVPHALILYFSPAFQTTGPAAAIQIISQPVYINDLLSSGIGSMARHLPRSDQAPHIAQDPLFSVKLLYLIVVNVWSRL